MDRFRRMEIFNAVVKTGQFTRAATSLNLSKSAVSHAISDLEEFLGVQLLIRSNRNFQLTKAGEDYHKNSVRLLADLAELESDTRHSDLAVSGLIRLSAPLAYANLELTPIITKFMDDNPAVTVELILTENVLDLIEDGIDLALRIGMLKDSGLISRKVSEVSHVLYASSDYLSQHASFKTPRDLENANCLKFSRTPVWNLKRGSKSYKIKPKGNLISNSGEALRELAIAGHGIAFLPEFLANEALSTGTLQQILPDYKSQKLNVSIVRPPGRHYPLRLKRLSDLIAENL